MIEQRAKSVWQANPTLHPSLVPSYIEEVSKKGGVFLIFNGVYLSVESAMKHWTLTQSNLRVAMDQLSKYQRASCLGDQIVYELEMIDAARAAGTFFRLYVRDLVFEDASPYKSQIPTCLESSTELVESWKQGYSSMDSILSHDPE